MERIGPYIMENKSHVPNHQPVIVIVPSKIPKIQAHCVLAQGTGWGRPGCRLRSLQLVPGCVPGDVGATTMMLMITSEDDEDDDDDDDGDDDDDDDDY